MYTPLKYMEQISSMITVHNKPSAEAMVNKDSIAYFGKLIEEDRAGSLHKWIHLWCESGDLNVDTDILPRDIVEDLMTYIGEVGVFANVPEEFYNLALLNIVYHDWSRSKRVYKIEDSMMDDLCKMTIPPTLPVSAITNLPSKCFYIDYGKNHEFCMEAVGCFVVYDICGDRATYNFTNLIDHDKVIPIHTNCEVTVDDELPLSGSLENFLESREMPLEDGSTVRFSERDFIKFIFNFCLYLRASNSDVEYTERTKQIYQPLRDGQEPKNKLREVEEFGVGYHYTTPIVGDRKRVKYVSTGDTVNDPNREKRSYSSNYRSAHWHHYWINDKENPGKKVLILKWVKETYVRGNVQNNNVAVHMVKK